MKITYLLYCPTNVDILIVDLICDSLNTQNREYLSSAVNCIHVMCEGRTDNSTAKYGEGNEMNQGRISFIVITIHYLLEFILLVTTTRVEEVYPTLAGGGQGVNSPVKFNHRFIAYE